MKRNLFFLLCLLLLGCQKEKETLLSLSDYIMTFNWEGSTKEMKVYSSEDWQISSEIPNWISVDCTQKEKNSDFISIRTSRNETKDSRSCNLTFTIADKEANLLITQTAKEKLLFVGHKEYDIEPQGAELLISIEQNISYETHIVSDETTWFCQSDSTNGLLDGFENEANPMWKNFLRLTVLANPTNKTRYAEIVICNKEFQLADTLRITQQANENERYYSDGEYLQIQQTSYGNANLVIMGDGFTQKEFSEKGNYENIMRQAMNYFFSIEPYQSYREYFNVYMVFAHSKEEGVSKNNLLDKVNNKFSSTYGTGTEITCNGDLVLDYAHKVKELPTSQPVTIIVVLNSTKYAGTTYLYSDGNSIALCPMSDQVSPNDFEGLIHHEAGGHAFGFLCDEYIYYNQKIPESTIKELQEWQKLSFQMNLDFTNDLSQIRWKDFIGLDNYENIGAYEGGYKYQYGIWRSEENSCMNNNIPYFNVQSRWSIVNRIMQLSQKTLTLEEFIQKDHPSYPQGRHSIQSDHKHPPLGSPKWIMTR